MRQRARRGETSTEKAAQAAAVQATGPHGLLFPVEALQRTAGNRAVAELLTRGYGPFPVVQTWKGPTRVPYAWENPHSKGALDHRDAERNWSPEPNVGVLVEGSHRDAVTSRGKELHAERLLIGRRLNETRGLVPDSDTDFAAYKAHDRDPASLYTERQPCGECVKVLDLALRDDDAVFYSVPLGTREKMERELQAQMEGPKWEREHEHDFQALAEIEQEQRLRDAARGTEGTRTGGLVLADTPGPSGALAPETRSSTSSPLVVGPPMTQVPPATEVPSGGEWRRRFAKYAVSRPSGPARKPLKRPKRTPDKAICSVCGNTVSLTQAGRLRKHKDGSSGCRMSGQSPRAQSLPIQ